MTSSISPDRFDPDDLSIGRCRETPRCPTIRAHTSKTVWAKCLRNDARKACLRIRYVVTLRMFGAEYLVVLSPAPRRDLQNS